MSEGSRVTVEVMRDGDRWDAYVRAAAPHRPYHCWVWREIVEETFGHRPYYLAAVADGRICGALPLIFIRSRIFGNALVSIPFFTYGGVVADNPDASDELLAYAAKLGSELGAQHVELRQGDELATHWAGTSSKVTMEVPLPATSDEYFNQLSTSRRKRLRYILKSQFHTEWGGLESVATFYRIFATNMRNLGTPVYPREFFANQLRRQPGRIRILTLRDGNRPVAAAFLTAHGDTLELPWAASLPESRKKEAPMVMYWTLIRRAIEEGFRKVDLGRCTPGGGNYEFKRHWKPVERPLHWYYWLAQGASLPNLHADNPKFRLATEIWKRLPLAIANGLGPHLVRSIP
jgi:FemAB-related protein (PEP-CTERM system-associated)